MRNLLMIPSIALAMVALGCDDASMGGFGGGSGDEAAANADAGAGGSGGGGGAGGGGGSPLDAGLEVDAAGNWGGAPDVDQGVPMGNTNVNLGGGQDIGYFRRLLDSGQVPASSDIDAAGFFAEHHTPLPTPDCGDRVCLQAMLGVMANIINGNNCTLLQIGLNSPLVAAPGNRPPLTLTVVIDTSGSMAGDGKIDFVRQGLGQMINELNDDDQIAIITYESNARLLQPMTALRGNRNTLHDVIGRLEPGGGTNIFDGLETGYREALSAYDSGRQNRLILLSDGQATAGNTNSDDILELSRLYNSEGVGLTTVGLGTDFNLPLMRGLAEQGDGNYYFVEDAAAVREVFSEELSYFTVPVAFDVEIRMSPGSDYRFVRSYGSSQWQDTAEGGGEVVVPSVFLAHRESHGDVGEGGTRRGGGSALLIELMPVPDPMRLPGEARVATVDLRFREPGTDLIIEQRAEVTYPEGPDELLLRGFFDNDIVEKSFVMLNIFVGIQIALDTWHFERDHDGARALIQRMIAAVLDYEDTANDGEGDVDMELNVELLRQIVDVMDQNGAQDNDEPLPEDPWPGND